MSGNEKKGDWAIAQSPFCLKGYKMQLYRVLSDYCDFLRQFDGCVPQNSREKDKRPFVGVVLSVNGMQYYAPLTSPKPKHLAMKNQIDFIKIDGGKLGAINLNNMIPIHKECLIPEQYQVLATDSVTSQQYKILLSKQISWCNAHQVDIQRKAEKLYLSITQNHSFPGLRERCCRFPLLEQKCLEYCQQHGLQIPEQLQGQADSTAEQPAVPSAQPKKQESFSLSGAKRKELADALHKAAASTPSAPKPARNKPGQDEPE